MSSEETVANPFQFGKPVTGELFCNRRQELARLRDLFHSRNSGWLYSPRRYGKTSLIKEAFALAEGDGFFTAYVDLLGLQGGLSITDLYLRGIGPLVPRMSGGIERALKTVVGLVSSFVPTISVDRDGSPVLSVAPAARLNDAEPSFEELLDLPEKLAERRDQRVVVAIDEFQEIARFPGLEARLRSVIQHHERVTYLMAGSRASLLRDLFTSPERPFFQFAEHIPIERIDAIEMVRYVLGRFVYSRVDLTEDTGRELVDLAACHPHFVQYFASIAWSLRREGVAEGNGLIERVVERIVASLDPGFRMFFDGLAPSQKRLLLRIAEHGGRLLMSDEARNRSRLGSASTVNSALSALAEKEVLSRRGEEWEFINPGFRLWVRAQV